MASWIIRDKDSIKKGQVDGYEVDRPDGFDPLNDSSYEKIQAIIWMDLNDVGMPMRAIASLFDVSKSHVSRSINKLPESIRLNRRPVDRYYDRLRKVVSMNPKNITEFAEFLQREAGTFGFEKIIFQMAGVRRSSVPTLLGCVRKSRAGSEDS